LNIINRLTFVVQSAISLTTPFFMTRNCYLLLALLLATTTVMAQKDKFEFGLSLGHTMITGDLNYAPGFGIGLHGRKAIDHVFSVRADAQYNAANARWDSKKVRADKVDETALSTLSGDIQVVTTLNNLKWFNSAHRKTNIYVFGGVGAAQMNTEITLNGIAGTTDNDLEFNGYITGGGGISLRISPKFNIGLEHKFIAVRSANADLLDGVQRFPSNAVFRELTQFPDVLHNTNVRLNFNLGGAKRELEPLYWVNPMAPVLDDIATLKAAPKFDLTDSDGDGIIDMLDQEKDTPAGAPVDTRGVALDSDGDGIINLRDSEPFSPPGFKVDNKGVAQIVKPVQITETDVNRLIDTKLAGYQPKGNANAVTSSLADWFLPIIHFDLDKSNIRTSEYGWLSNVASVMKNNPTVRVVVVGHTDKTGSPAYNRNLSYNRAQAAANHLVKAHGIDRSRLIVQYSGEDTNLVPTSGQTIMNRRVEFRVAQGNESEMERPASDKRSGGRSGF